MAKDKVTFTELVKQRLFKRTKIECQYCGHKLLREKAPGEVPCFVCPTCSKRWRR